MIPMIHFTRGTNSLRWIWILFILSLIIASVCPAAAARDVRVAVPDLRPSLFLDEKGEPAGFFVDLLEDLAAEEGWNLIWIKGTLSESWDRLLEGDIDLL